MTLISSVSDRAHSRGISSSLCSKHKRQVPFDSSYVGPVSGGILGSENYVRGVIMRVVWRIWTLFAFGE